MSPGTLSREASDPEHFRALTERHRSYLEESHPIMGPHLAHNLARQAANGSLEGWLWKCEDGTAEGMVEIASGGPPARVHGVWLEPANTLTLGEMMDDIEHEFDSPLGSITDVLPRIGPTAQALVFGRRGFWHREKILMRRGAEKPAGIGFVPPEVRAIRPTDLEAVVGIYVRAYADRPGEFWTWGRPDNWANARDDVMSHIDSNGKWSPNFLADASVVWDAGGQVVGAVLVVESPTDQPYVEDAIVEPELHRRGIGRALMSAAIDRILQVKPRSIELAATRFGAPYRLYQRLGFDEVPPPAGSLDGDWVRGPSPF